MMQPELCIDASYYEKKFPTFAKPKIIGCIALENLKFARKICDEKVNLDLNRKIDQVKRKPQDLDVRLTELLKFLLNYEKVLQLRMHRTLDEAAFHCYRGLMTLVACTPYERKDSWKIVVILYKGNIYLCARDTEEKIKRNRNMSEKDKTFTSWGYKFEQYMLSDTPDSEPNPDLPVDETEEFSLVFTTHLNKHTIVYGAEMDGIRCDRAPVNAPPKKDCGLNTAVDYLSTKEFIELKTNRHFEFPNQETNFRRHKTKKWWCQSFLVGVDTILCGFRNDSGIVEQLKVFDLKELPKMSQRFWKPDVMFNFLDTFFTYVKRCLARHIDRKYGQKALNNIIDLPLVSFMLEWSPGQPVRVNDSYCHDDDPILESWFIENYCKTSHLLTK